MKQTKYKLIWVLCFIGLAGCQSDVIYHLRTSGELHISECDSDRLLSVPTTANRQPLWSPNGRLIAYFGEDRSGPGIFVTDRRVSFVTNLTASAAAIPTMDFTWGPDSEWLYYSALNTAGHVSIYRVRVTGSTPPIPLTPLSLDSKHPTIAPDGEQMAYASVTPSAPDSLDIYTSRTNGQNRTRLTTTPGVDEQLPAWGPDGRIAFIRARDVMLPDVGGTLIDVGDYAGRLSPPNLISPDRLAWSRDAGFIAFHGGGGKIYLAQTSPPYSSRCLTCDPDVGLHLDESPKWYSSDRRIVFDRVVGRLPPAGSPQGAFSIATDGTGERLIFDGGHRPDPRPRISRLCF